MARSYNNNNNNARQSPPAWSCTCCDGQVETRKACKIRAGQRVEMEDVSIHIVSDEPLS